MAWNPGELWLDTDVLWFRERAGPAFSWFAPVPLPAMGPPPGLAASRRRRAARKHHRNLRRVQATAIALSPAVIFPIAAMRTGSHGTRLDVEDPPSLTFRIPTGHADRPFTRAPGSKAKEVTRRVTPAGVFPEVEWHHATSVGLPFDGKLIDGTQLPVEGPDWVTWDPVTHSVPNLPHRLYGNQHTISTILTVVRQYRDANPDAPRVVIGDISLDGGGPMRDEHVSHQNGLDVDIYYPRADGTLRDPVNPDNIDHRLAQDLLNRFVAAGAQMIFVGFSTGLHGPSGVVIPYPDHDNHMHVRFPPPGG